MLSVEDLPAEHASIANVESQHLDLSHHGKPSVRLTRQENINLVRCAGTRICAFTGPTQGYNIINITSLLLLLLLL
jgi:hypothetical protein